MVFVKISRPFSIHMCPVLVFLSELQWKRHARCRRCACNISCASLLLLCAGAWIKNQVARGILLGGRIKTVRQFFEYCERYLVTEANSRVKKRKFTARRIFYLVEVAELAQYRKALPKLNTWSNARKHYAFWAGGEINVISRKWLACVCSRCMAGVHDECEHWSDLSVDDMPYNEVTTATLVPTHIADLNRSDDIARSRKVG